MSFRTLSASVLFTTAALAVGGVTADAAVLNPSFEQPPVPAGGFTASNPSTIPNWSGAGTGVGNVGVLGSDFGPFDGSQHAYLNLNDPGTAFLEQTLSDVVGPAGSTYDLSVRYKGPGGNIADVYRLVLKAGSTVLGSTSSTSGSTDWQLLTLPTYTVASGDPIGTPLTIRLEADRTGGNFQQPRFDDVRFSAAAVPEPMTMGTVLMLATGGLLLRSRR